MLLFQIPLSIESKLLENNLLVQCKSKSSRSDVENYQRNIILRLFLFVRHTIAFAWVINIIYICSWSSNEYAQSNQISTLQGTEGKKSLIQPNKKDTSPDCHVLNILDKQDESWGQFVELMEEPID